MDLIRYLNQYFLTHEQLLARCAIAEAELQAFQQRGMMPMPSYRLRLDIGCDSFFGAHTEQAEVAYYAHGYPAWLGLLQALPDPEAACRVFAERYRAQVGHLASTGIAPKVGFCTDAHLAAEWGHFLAGTYGLCTVSGLPEDIASKEVAIAVIKEITGAGAERALTDAEHAHLTRAVDLLDQASTPFAAHEVARSSRRRYVDEVRKAWRL